MRALQLLSVALLALVANVANAAECDTTANITYPQNNIPVWKGNLTFVTQVANGMLFTAGEADDLVHVVHVWGNNGYDFGYAAGSMLKEQITETLSGAWNYFVGQIESVVNGTSSKYDIPPWLVDFIAEKGLEFVLDWQNDESKPYMDPEIYAEMRGLSDSTGLDYDMIRRIHLIGEITQAQCSLYGAWGDATLGGKTLQLRALDWDLGPGLQNHPTVTIYHPQNPALGHPFANIGWAGWIGTLTGMSSAHIGISEIGVSYPNYPPYFGNESFVGIPFIFLERKVIQYATSYKMAESQINNATRTCNLILGVGDGIAKTARMVQYSHSIVRFFNDTDLEPQAWWHPRIDSMVYSGMDWFCPFYQHALSRQLKYAHGQLTPELSIQNVTAVVGTGDLHAAVYDLTDLKLFVGNARRDDVATGERKAYGRQWNHIDVKREFNRALGQI